MSLRTTPGSTLRCETCDCTWQGELICFNCGKPGAVLDSLMRLRMHRSLHGSDGNVDPL
jgi:hypothetical protein